MTTNTLTPPIAGPGIASRDHNLPSGDELLVMVSKDPALPLTDSAILDRLVEALQQVTADAPKSTDTDADRKAIREAGRKISAYRSAIDKARLATTKGLRDQVAAINAVGQEVEARLSALQDSVEKPLKDWQESERVRLATIDRTRNTILAAAQNLHALPSSAIAERIAQVEAIEFPAAVFVEGTMAIEDDRATVLRQLGEAKAVAEQREAQEAELAQLRAKAQQEAYARSIIQHIIDCGNGFIGGQPQPFGILLHELQNKIVIDSSFGELEAQARALLESTLAKVQGAYDEQIKRNEQEAAQRAAEQAATAAQQEAQRQIDEANARAAQAEADAQAEREHIAAEQREQARQRQAAIDAEEARKRNQRHRTKIHDTAATAIVAAAAGVTDEQAKAIVMAIAAGNVPAVSIQY